AAEAGLPTERELWVVVGHAADAAHWQSMLRPAAGRGLARLVAARLGGRLAAVGAGDPTEGPCRPAAARQEPQHPPAAGVAGPVTPEGLGTARRLAESALAAAQVRGCSGLVHVAEVATV